MCAHNGELIERIFKANKQHQNFITVLRTWYLPSGFWIPLTSGKVADSARTIIQQAAFHIQNTTTKLANLNVKN